MSHLHASRQRTIFDYALSWIFEPEKVRQRTACANVSQIFSRRDLQPNLAKCVIVHFILVLVSSGLYASIASAQDADEDIIVIDEVVVTATRIPTPLADTLPSTAIITSDQIERIKPRDLGDLLSRTSGLQFRDSGGRGSTGGIFVRGASSDHVLILINGVRTGSATLGSTRIENIPIESIDRIEVIKGPMSGVYGSDAIGGVVQIFTKQNRDEKTFGLVRSTFGTNRFRNYHAQAGYSEDSYRVHTSLSKESTDGHDRTAYKGAGNEDRDSFEQASWLDRLDLDRALSGNEDRDGFEQASGSFSINGILQNSLIWGLDYVESSAKTEYDNTLTSTVDLMPQKDNPQTTDIDETESYDEHQKRLKGYEDECPAIPYKALAKEALAKLGVERARAPSPTSHRICKGREWHQRSKQETTSARIEYPYSEELTIQGTLGVSADSNRAITPDKKENDLFKTKKIDYTIQANLVLSEENQISSGADYQQDKITSTNHYAATQRINKGIYALWQNQLDRSSTVLSVRHDRNNSYGSNSNYSLQQSFDLTEKYRIVAGYGTAFKAPTFNDLYWPDSGNPDLEPEKSRSLELSFRANSDDQFWQVSLYQAKLKNLIAWAPNSDGDWKPANVDKATLEGVEFEFTKEWNEYIAGASFSYLEAYDEKKGTFLQDRARASAAVEAGRQIENLYIGIDGFAEHGRHSDNKGTTLPGYAVWGLSADYTISDSFSVSGHIDNLFDKKYITNIATSDNPYQNEGRTIRVSLEYRF